MSKFLTPMAREASKIHDLDTQLPVVVPAPPAGICGESGAFDDIVPADVRNSLVAAGQGGALEPAQLPKARRGIDLLAPPCELIDATVEDIEGVENLPDRAVALYANPHLVVPGERAAALFNSIRDASILGRIMFELYMQVIPVPLPAPLVWPKPKRRRKIKEWQPPLPWLFTPEELKYEKPPVAQPAADDQPDAHGEAFVDALVQATSYGVVGDGEAE